MAQSPFTFLRGAAAVMARDLSRLPRIGLPRAGLRRLSFDDFGAFNTPEERMLFDINDFDETLPGVDFTVDLKRLVASIAVRRSRCWFIGLKRPRAFAQGAAKAYREFIRELAEMTAARNLVFPDRYCKEVERISDEKLRDKLSSILIKSKKELAEDDNFPHLATAKGGVPHIADHPPLIYHFDTDASA